MEHGIAWSDKARMVMARIARVGHGEVTSGKARHREVRILLINFFLTLN